MVTPLLLLSLAGCAPIFDDTGTGDTAAGPELLAAALGNCTATITYGVNAAPYSTEAVSYDANGDVTSVVGTVIGDDALSYVYATTYGAAHEPAEITVTYPMGDPTWGYVVNETWLEGEEVEYQQDLGSDGTIDYDYRTTYEGPKAVALESDTNGDGIVDITATRAYTAHGPWWEVSEVGTSTLTGDFTAEYTEDAAFRLLAASTLDGAGNSTDLGYAGYNDLGFPLGLWASYATDGVPTSEASVAWSFDVEQRPAGSINASQTYADGVPSENRWVESTYTYDCP